MEWIKKRARETAVPLLIVGAAWGIFEATAGYALHLLPVRVGFLVWYPVAVFFLLAAFRITGKKSAILATAALAAAVKLLNLLLPGPVDRVVNPAVSILLEGIAVFAAVYAFERATGTLLVSIGTNTLWRVLYLSYLAFLVPDWMREVSVLRSGGALLRFMVVDNICSSLVVYAGARFVQWPRMRYRLRAPSGVLLCAALLAVNITLQLML